MTLQGETTYPVPTDSFVDPLGAAQWAAEGAREPRLSLGAALVLWGLISLGLWAGIFGLINAALS